MMHLVSSSPARRNISSSVFDAETHLHDAMCALNLADLAITSHGHENDAEYAVERAHLRG